jgi:hypothetical protein
VSCPTDTSCFVLDNDDVYASTTPALANPWTVADSNSYTAPATSPAARSWTSRALARGCASRSIKRGTCSRPPTRPQRIPGAASMWTTRRR